MLVGLPPEMMDLLAKTGIAHHLGNENLFAIADRHFSALELALRRALELAGEHDCGDTCPLRECLSKHTVSVLKARTI